MTILVSPLLHIAPFPPELPPMAVHPRRSWMPGTIRVAAEKYCLSHCHSMLDYHCSPYCVDRCPAICPYPIPTPLPDPPAKSHKPSPALIVIIVLLSSALLLACLFTLYLKVCYRRRRPLTPGPSAPEATDEFIHEDHGPVVDHPIWYIRTVGLQPSVIGAIAVIRYRKDDGLVDVSDCAVCLSEFCEGETLRLLQKCNHAFHIPCIDTWLRSHTNCPMCRAGIVVDTGQVGAPFSVHENPGPPRDVQLRISDGNEESRRGVEDGVGELGFGIEEEAGPRSSSGFCSRESLKEGGAVGDALRMRRSVSMDSVAAAAISVDVADVSPVESVESSGIQFPKIGESNADIVARRGGWSQRSLGAMSSSPGGRHEPLKRSLSCGPKLFLSRNGRRSISYSSPY